MFSFDITRSLTHLSMRLKYNPIGFNEMLLHPDKSPHRSKRSGQNNSKAYLIEYLQMQQSQFQSGEGEGEGGGKDAVDNRSVKK